MKAKFILSLVAFLFVYTVQAQNDPFANTLTASSEDSNTNTVAVKTEAKEEALVKIANAEDIRTLQDVQPYQTVLLDTRSKEEYSSFKIGGARWIGDEFSAQKVWMLHRNSTIIIYGNTFTDEYVTKFCKNMNAMGFEDVRVYSGGIIDWINQGHTVVNNRNRKTTKYKFDNRKLNRLLK